MGVGIWGLSHRKALQFIKHVLCRAVPGIQTEMNALAPPFDELTVQQWDNYKQTIADWDQGVNSSCGGCIFWPNWRASGGFLEEKQPELSLERWLKLLIAEEIKVEGHSTQKGWEEQSLETGSEYMPGGKKNPKHLSFRISLSFSNILLEFWLELHWLYRWNFRKSDIITMISQPFLEHLYFLYLVTFSFGTFNKA